MGGMAIHALQYGSGGGVCAVAQRLIWRNQASCIRAKIAL
jgi:hypothetical protein